MESLCIRELAQAALSDLGTVIGQVDESQLDALATAITAADRVFVAGAGRTGLVMRCFAMRLMHLGLSAHVVGETTTPAAGTDDLLVVGSGSGRTAGLCAVAARAVTLGVPVAVVTASPTSALAVTGSVVLHIPGAVHGGDGPESAQPAGNEFEQALLMTLDAIVVALARLMSVDFGRTLPRHANLE